MIDEIIEAGIPTQPGASGQLHYARQETNGRKARPISALSGGGDDSDEDDEGGEYQPEDEITETLQQPAPRKRGRPPKEGDDSANQTSPRKRQRASNGMEDGTQASQWDIRVGADAPPTWSKQKFVVIRFSFWRPHERKADWFTGKGVQQKMLSYWPSLINMDSSSTT
jgi:hypothetical protein